MTGVQKYHKFLLVLLELELRVTMVHPARKVDSFDYM